MEIKSKKRQVELTGGENMNLNEERNYQKLMDTVEALELSEKNRKLAEEYFAAGTGGQGTSMDGQQEQRLLKKAELQDFSGLAPDRMKKSTDYVEHLKKRKRTEELARYVRFAAAVGGSTAHYLLNQYGWGLRDIRECLTPEQRAAIQAEGIVWNQYTLAWSSIKELCQEAKKDLKTIRRAMALCCHKYDNAKVLLAAVYLHEKKRLADAGNRGSLFKNFFGRNVFESRSMYEDNNGLEDRKVEEFLEKNLADSLPAVFSPAVSGEEAEKLRKYVKRGEPYGVFPQELLGVLSGKKAHQYLLTLLSGCAFLAQKHSLCCLSFLQVMAASEPEWTLDACRLMSEVSWFEEHTRILEQVLPVKPDVFIRWYLKNKVAGGLRRMAKQNPECVRTEGERAQVEDYQYLMKQIQAGNPALYQQMNAAYSGHYRSKLADELTQGLANGRAEAKQYLLGETALDTLYPFVYSWRGNGGYFYGGYRRLESMEKEKNLMYHRAVILEALKMQGGYFTYSYLPRLRGKEPADLAEYENRLEALAKLFEAEKMPIQYQADAMEGIYSSYYIEQDKNQFLDTAVKVLARRLGAHREEFYTALQRSTAVGRDICYRVLDEDWQREKEMILAGALDSSKQVKETLVLICAGHREWEPEMKRLLASKKSQERELAIRVLRKWGAEHYQEELQRALETEKSKKLKELLQTNLGLAVSGAGEASSGAGSQTPEELVGEVLKGGKKRKAAWAYETPFSEVHKKDGTLASEEYLQAILVCYADMTVPGVSPEAARLARELDEQELSRYVFELFDKWMESGAEAKKKWVLYAASIHGGEEIVPLFWKQIQDWPQHARGALAAEAVKALALNGSSEALLQVDQIARKFKFRQVKTAAAQALDYAASALGISRAELEDRIVPTLGFDEKLERSFDYGTRVFRVYLTPALELEIFDGEGKRLKNLPAPGKRDEEGKAAGAYAEFKQLKKQLKTVAAGQKLRLEQALTAERLWSAQQWKTLFVKNPVMHQFAIGLIWGLYEDGSLKDTFRYMEDGSFNTRDEDEFEFPEEGMVGLVHPIELSEEELSAWKEQLSDYEIIQPFEQLERPVYRLTEEEKGKEELTRFGGKVLNGLSLSGKLQGMGWYKGSVQDAGVYMTFYREDGELGVELEFSGSYVGDENEDVTVYGAAFYKAGTVKRGSYVYDTIKKENRYTLDQVSPRYFSEIVLQLTRATASSQEQLPYPECKE